MNSSTVFEAKKTILFLAIICLAGVFSVFGQETVPSKTQVCLSADEIKMLREGLESPRGNVAFNRQLEQEIGALGLATVTKTGPNANTPPSGAIAEEKPALIDEKICSLLRSNGWITKTTAGEQGASDFLFMLKHNTSFDLQRALFPLVAKAAEKGELKRDVLLASFIDNVRVNLGVKQWFGTQAIAKDGFLYLLPIENQANVDARRKIYNMEPLTDYVRFLERQRGMPMLWNARLANEAAGIEFRNSSSAPTVSAVQVTTVNSANEDEEVIKIDTSMVNIDVNVYNDDRTKSVAILNEKDFRVIEDGVPQEKALFTKTESPFDLVLLLDLSGSTSEKTKLIRSSARRFIEAARPVDRIAIVTFAYENKIVSGFSSNKQQLLRSTDKIKDYGGSRVWDALRFTLDDLLKAKEPGRRRAIVLMTDGVDNALLSQVQNGSRTSFAELMDSVWRSEAAVIPIYLDTEPNNPAQGNAYKTARQTLQFLADESGGLYYHAGKLEDLNGVYDQVLKDLSRVYSIGYSPKNEKRGGEWRAIRVEIPGQPALKTRTRSGYYAN